MSNDGRKTQLTAAIRREPASAPEASGDGACLVMIVGKEIGKRFPLDAPRMTIGRGSRCEILIDDGSISRQHAVLVKTPDGFAIEDQGSTNGTMLNDDYVTAATLTDGALIRVGRTVLKFLSGQNLEHEYYAEIYRLTTTDGLTQVYNRRYFFEHLERELARALRYERRLALVMVDIDHFKELNDTHGHLAGDAVLRSFAERVHQTIRRADTLARYGGEEFAIVAPECGLAEAAQLAEKVRRVVEQTPFTVDHSAISVTASLGVADLDSYVQAHPEGPDGARREVPSPELLVRLADQRLYRAKAAGRNRVAT